MRSLLLLLAGMAIGVLAFAAFELRHGSDHHPPHTLALGPETAEHKGEGRLKLDDAQLQASGIAFATVRGGALQNHLLVTGSVISRPDNVGRVSVRLIGTVAELRKGLGDPVEQGEIVAIVESREVADAKSEYLGSAITNELQQTLAARIRSLWETKTATENDYLRSRLTAQEAQIRHDSARQKLFALGLSDAEIADLPKQPVAGLRKLALRAPIGGRIAERRVDLGALVGREGQESELFVIVNLDQVWVDLAVSPADLMKVRERATIAITSAASGQNSEANVVFVSPLLDRETRNARVIASMANPGHAWRPGTFVTAEVPLGGEPARALIPKSALQTVNGDTVVFTRSEDGLEARKIRIGREDDNQYEVLEGVSEGDTIAVSNTFTLKAELGKADAEDSHGH